MNQTFYMKNHTLVITQSLLMSTRVVHILISITSISSSFHFVFQCLNVIGYHFFLSLSDIMGLRHQSSAMWITMLGGEDTHPSATKVGNPIPATIPVTKKNNQQAVGYFWIEFLCERKARSKMDRRF